MSTSRLLTRCSISSTDAKGYPDSRRKATPVAAQLASHDANNSPVVQGPVISLAPRHAKVRRVGYRQ